MGAGEKVPFARISDVVERTFGSVASDDIDGDPSSDSRVNVILPPPTGGDRGGPRSAPLFDPTGAMARTQLIGEIAQVIQHPNTPEHARRAGLTLIGWLAERRPEEPPHAVGIEEARASEIRLQSVRAKAQ